MNYVQILEYQKVQLLYRLQQSYQQIHAISANNISTQLTNSLSATPWVFKTLAIVVNNYLETLTNEKTRKRYFYAFNSLFNQGFLQRSETVWSFCQLNEWSELLVKLH